LILGLANGGKFQNQATVKTRIFCIVLLALLANLHPVFAQGTAFTYQGRLNENGSPAGGNYDFTFALFNTDSTNTGQVGNTLTNLDVGVTNGLFTVVLDFGANFPGASRWLDIGVRSNGGVTFTALNPLQELTPAPYAIYSPNAGNAATATSASTAGTANSANSVAASNISGTISNSSLPASPSFSGTVTATGFSGSGSGLGNLNVSQLTNGTVADARLSTNVDLLNANQTLTGAKTFSNNVVVSSGSGSMLLSVLGSATGNFATPLSLIENKSTAANASPALRVVGFGAAPNGVLSVSSEGTGLLAQFGNSNSFVAQLDTNGNWTANSFSGGGSGLTGVNAITLGGGELSSVDGENGLGAGTNIYLNDYIIHLRNDNNHGLAYNGGGITNFPSAAVQPDGPVLWGYTGGALGVLNGGAAAALSWNNSSVSVANALNVGGNAAITGTLSADNTPGVGFDETNNADIEFESGEFIPIASYSAAKPAVGYFVIMASAEIGLDGNAVILELEDTTSSPVVLAATETNPGSINQVVSMNLSWVEPITVVGGNESFDLDVFANGPGLSSVFYENLTVMYFPRHN
jgi:hypothetical protein